MLSQNAEMLNYTQAIPEYREKAALREYPAAAAPGVWTSHRSACLAVLAAAGMMIVIYFISGITAQMSYDMQELRTEIIALERQNAVLRLDVARMESPARIQAIAETELGMTVPQHAIYGSSDAYAAPVVIHE